MSAARAAAATLEVSPSVAMKVSRQFLGAPKRRRAAGAPEVHKHLPFRVAYAVGVACDGLWSVLPLQGEPPMTRFLAEQLSTSHWYSMAPATRDFGYVPKVTMAEGMERLRASIA